jgi:hypothetical protein
MSFASPTDLSLAGSGAKKLNEGLPLERNEIASLTSLFLQNQYFAHIKFGIDNGRIEPEEIIKNIRKEDAEKFEFVLLMGYLLRNGLDPNYYFEGPYKVSIHIAVFINTVAGGSEYKNCVYDVMQDSGSNFLSPAYTGGRVDSKTVMDIIKFNKPTGNINLDNYFYPKTKPVPGNFNMEWKEIKKIVLDKKFDFPKTIGKDPLKSVTIFNMVVTTSAIRLIESSEDACFFWNTYLGMQQSVYLSINGQNFEVFQNVIEKGGELDYLSMTELICRYNLAAKDNILRDTYGKMISYAIKTGTHIDNRQLQMLALEGTVDLIEGIREDFRNPEWKKLCRKTQVKSGLANKRLRQIAFDLNIDFGLSSAEICSKLENISNVDRLTYFNTAIERQKERIARTLMEAGDVRESDSLERFRCNNRTTLINNPYAYNDGRVAFYTDKGELWCFTSDLFDSLIATETNPYTKEKLPDSFLETIKSQVNILEFLSLKKSKDQRSIDESLKDVFDSKNEVSNRYSDDIYNSYINEMSIIARVRETDVRGILKPLDMESIMVAYLNLSFTYFSDCKDLISIIYTTNKKLDDITNLANKNFKNSPANFIFQDTRCYQLFKSMKTIEYLKDGKFLEIFYVIIAYLFNHFMRKYMRSKDNKKNTFYGANDYVKELEAILKETFGLPP